MMPAKHPSRNVFSQSPHEPDDNFLLTSILSGDEVALQALIKRYDRLVRYTIYHASKKYCQKDPQWLETVASNTWMGLMQSLRRNPSSLPLNLLTYLLKIAHNQALTAIRQDQSHQMSPSSDDFINNLHIKDTLDSPDQLLSDIEELEILRVCIAALDEDHRRLISQLDAITNRRWKEAANALGMQESTLRSRWVRVKEQLSRCMKEKSGKSFAPEQSECD